jgi:hypothetical protein
MDQRLPRLNRIPPRSKVITIHLRLIFSSDLLNGLKPLPEVDIWHALVKSFDMGDKYSTFFSTFLGTPCKLAYVDLNGRRYIQGTLPPEYAQNGKHPITGLSDGAPFLFALHLHG